MIVSTRLKNIPTLTGKHQSFFPKNKANIFQILDKSLHQRLYTTWKFHLIHLRVCFSVKILAKSNFSIKMTHR